MRFTHPLPHFSMASVSLLRYVGSVLKSLGALSLMWVGYNSLSYCTDQLHSPPPCARSSQRIKRERDAEYTDHDKALSAQQKEIELQRALTQRQIDALRSAASNLERAKYEIAQLSHQYISLEQIISEERRAHVETKVCNCPRTISNSIVQSANLINRSGTRVTFRRYLKTNC